MLGFTPWSDLAEHDFVELAIVIPDDYAYDCFRVPAAKLGGRCVYTKGAKHCSEVIGYACVEGQCFEWPLDGELSFAPCHVVRMQSSAAVFSSLRSSSSESSDRWQGSKHHHKA